MRIEPGIRLPNGVIVGYYQPRAGIEDTTETSRAGLRQIARYIIKHFAPGRQFDGRTIVDIGPVPNRKLSTDIHSAKDMVFLVRRGGGTVHFQGGTQFDVNSSWIFVPAGHRFKFKGGSTTPDRLTVVGGKLSVPPRR